MLDKKVFKEQIEKLIIVFPNWGIDASNSQAMKTWYGFFQEVKNEDFRSGIDQYIKKERFNPSVAGLMESINNVNPYKGMRWV